VFPYFAVPQFYALFYSLSLLSIKNVFQILHFPGFFTVFSWFPQKCKIEVLLYKEEGHKNASCLCVFEHATLVTSAGTFTTFPVA
jgi:hypothetical protein